MCTINTEEMFVVQHRQLVLIFNLFFIGCHVRIGLRLKFSETATLEDKVLAAPNSDARFATLISFDECMRHSEKNILLNLQFC